MCWFTFRGRTYEGVMETATAGCWLVAVSSSSSSSGEVWASGCLENFSKVKSCYQPKLKLFLASSSGFNHLSFLSLVELVNILIAGMKAAYLHYGGPPPPVKVYSVVIIHWQIWKYKMQKFIVSISCEQIYRFRIKTKLPKNSFNL